MSVLIHNIYSYGNSELKQEYIPNFNSFDDLATSGNYILNLKQKLKKIGPNKYALENRSISGIVLDSLYDLGNVFKLKQPRGFNPVITNITDTKVYKINIDWTLYSNTIITNLNEPLFLTFISTHSINDLVDTIVENDEVYRFGNFTSISNNPILSDGIDFTTPCVMESTGDLNNSTIYISFKTKNHSVGSFLTDNITSIKIESDKIFIISDKYETPFINVLPNTGYCIACIISDDFIEMYYKKNIKSGKYIYTEPNDKKLYIKLDDCIIYNISINKSIHSHNAILNNILKFQTQYNL